MKYTKSNLKCHELIGLEVRVVDHSDKGLVGLSGRVVWETKNVLVIESSGREVKVPKNFAVFSFKLPSSGSLVTVSGEEILSVPEERVKNCR
ncbi:MAG: ribonuclease P protein component 1 [Sulfolobales archaeon]|nr:ribonuclease P protein component 1 [Sulfolobales archaeon]MCX8208870.1 ribonuclease P protein component 1 [Sulfolobales archaeon]MDW8010707.1 ribonuclease P protein component 1 [Sulfolobales archaeon]